MTGRDCKSLNWQGLGLPKNWTNDCGGIYCRLHLSPWASGPTKLHENGKRSPFSTYEVMFSLNSMVRNH